MASVLLSLLVLDALGSGKERLRQWQTLKPIGQGTGQRDHHHTLSQQLLGDKLVSPEDSEALRLPGDLSTLPFAFYPSSCDGLQYMDHL